LLSEGAQGAKPKISLQKDYPVALHSFFSHAVIRLLHHEFGHKVTAQGVKELHDWFQHKEGRKRFHTVRSVNGRISTLSQRGK